MLISDVLIILFCGVCAGIGLTGWYFMEDNEL